MSVTISPLDLLLDANNPRFVVLNRREQADIRKYLVTYEDVCNLAVGINSYGGILPGERIVALKCGDQYVVMEGNRRTCSLQLLLNRDLIPDGFQHRIPTASESIKSNCQTIEIDVLPNREAALELMTKRHIEGVRQWKPLAKKQFFAANYEAGQSISNLSRITGLRESEIKSDIKDYRFFYSAYTEYCRIHTDYHGQIIDLKIDPFLRIFKAKFSYKGTMVKPLDVLKISYTDSLDTTSSLPPDIFKQIVLTTFEEATITEQINTRNTLKDVSGVIDILDSLENSQDDEHSSNSEGRATNNHSSGNNDSSSSSSQANSNTSTSHGNEQSSNYGSDNSNTHNPNSDRTHSDIGDPGGPAPRVFFETLSWNQRLSPHISEHAGLLAAAHELYMLSTTSCNRKKAYEVFPVATGMVLRTAYEQVLISRLKQTNLWSDFMSNQPRGRFPTLQAMETFIAQVEHKSIVLPTPELRTAFDMVQRYAHREFLNANIHNPGDIHVSAESLSAIAQCGMFTLMQESINQLEEV